jgi:protease-4
MASDLIWREIRLTNEMKPVIVSFGDVAASGGFFIAAAGQKILASPSTVTGSIGVIGGKFNVQKFLSRVGINVDTVSKGSHAGYTSLTRPFTKEEAQRIRGHLQDFYENLFLKRVAENRNKTIDEIRPLAEGRVWTGSQAFERALIDEVGGIREAIEAARKASSVEKFRIIGYVQRRRLRDLFSGQILDAFPDDGILALMPKDLNIR